MKNVLLVAFIGLVTLSCVSAVFWGDFRITFGQDPTKQFQRLARTAREAEAGNWIREDAQEECDSGLFKGFRYVDPNDDSVVLIYDQNGVIAGIQAQMPHKVVLTPGNTFRYERVPMFQNITIRGEEFFVLTAYFVNPFTICSPGLGEDDLVRNGTGTGLWFQSGPSANFLIEVPKDRATGWSKGWSKNNCFQAMGTHNFYQTERFEEHSCNEMRPTFILFDKTDDQMLGFGFAFPGLVQVPRFEQPPNAILDIIVNPAPPCLLAMNDRIGFSSMHVYFVDQPWTIAC